MNAPTFSWWRWWWWWKWKILLLHFIHIYPLGCFCLRDVWERYCPPSVIIVAWVVWAAFSSIDTVVLLRKELLTEHLIDICQQWKLIFKMQFNSWVQKSQTLAMCWSSQVDRLQSNSHPRFLQTGLPRYFRDWMDIWSELKTFSDLWWKCNTRFIAENKNFWDPKLSWHFGLRLRLRTNL